MKSTVKNIVSKRLSWTKKQGKEESAADVENGGTDDSTTEAPPSAAPDGPSSSTPKAPPSLSGYPITPERKLVDASVSECVGQAPSEDSDELIEHLSNVKDSLDEILSSPYKGMCTLLYAGNINKER